MRKNVNSFKNPSVCGQPGAIIGCLCVPPALWGPKLVPGVSRARPGCAAPPGLAGAVGSQAEGILIGFTAEPDRAYSRDVMKTDDPVLSPWCCEEKGNYSLHPGGRLHSRPSLAPAPHLAPAGSPFFPPSWISAFPAPSAPFSHPRAWIWRSGAGPDRWGEDFTAGMSWERTCCGWNFFFQGGKLSHSRVVLWTAIKMSQNGSGFKRKKGTSPITRFLFLL